MNMPIKLMNQSINQVLSQKLLEFGTLISCFYILFGDMNIEIGVQLKVTDLNANPEIKHKLNRGGARGVMVIAGRNGHGDTSSDPGRDWLHFT